MNFVSLDLETADNEIPGSICSIGMVRVANGECVDSFARIINPECSFAWYCTKVHGIDESAVTNEPSFKQLYDDIASFIGDYPLIAYNASFDMRVLAGAYMRYDLDVPSFPYYCAMELSKAALPLIPKHNLKAVADVFDHHFTHHQALDDAKACAHIVRSIAAMADASSVEELFNTAHCSMRRLEKVEVSPPKEKKAAAPKDPFTYRGSTVDIQTVDRETFFSGKVVVFSGDLLRMDRDSAVQHINRLGATEGKSITKKTDVLVVGTQDMRKTRGKHLSGKHERALEMREIGLPIEIIDEETFFSMISRVIPKRGESQ